MGGFADVGHAARRRMGAPANAYGHTVKPPTHGVGDMVRATGRYGPLKVLEVIPNLVSPGLSGHDGHGYRVSGGMYGHESVHLSGELRPFNMGMGEMQ
jgi:hypothetical protein